MKNYISNKNNMSTIFEERFATHPEDARSYDTVRLRQEYLVSNMMKDNLICLTYTQYDRYVVGGAVPLSGSLQLEPIDPIKAEYFCERRELGIVNVGGGGMVTVDGTVYVRTERMLTATSMGECK